MSFMPIIVKLFYLMFFMQIVYKDIFYDTIYAYCL